LAKESAEINVPIFDKEYKNIVHHENDNIYKRRLRKIMWDDMGIIRTKKGLLEAKNIIYDMKNRDIGRLLELRLNTASAIVDAALKRKESLGTHYIE